MAIQNGTLLSTPQPVTKKSGQMNLILSDNMQTVQSRIVGLNLGGVGILAEDMELFLSKLENKELYESYKARQ